MPHLDRLLLEVVGKWRPRGTLVVWRPRAADRFVLHRRLETLRLAAKFAAAFAVALLWLAAVALLAHGLASWWAEQASNATAAGVVPVAPFSYTYTLE